MMLNIFSQLANFLLIRNSKDHITKANYVFASVLLFFVLFLVAIPPQVRALNPANGDFEAENITNKSSTNIKPFTDSTASGGKSLQFWVNGTATQATTTPNITKVIVYAKGVPCSGAPIMTLNINGSPVLNTAVSNVSYGAFEANVALNSGTQSIQLGFTNDYYASPSCDRNLIVDRIEFTPGTITPPPGCSTTAPLPTNSDPGTVVMADGFESNNFNSWSSVIQESDGTATIQTQTIKTDNCAAKIHATSNLTSRANISKLLPVNSHEIWATGWFNITREGASTSSNVPTFRLFNGSTRLLDVSRQNGSGAFFVRWPTTSGFSINNTGRTLNVGQWYNIKINALANGSTSQVRVWLDGTEVFNRTNTTTGYATFGSFTTFSNLMVGAEHVQQDGDFVADDVVAKVL